MILSKQISLLFGFVQSGQKVLLAVSDSREELFDMALNPETTCGGRFNVLSIETLEGLDFAKAAADEDDAAADAADAMLERVIKAAKH